MAKEKKLPLENLLVIAANIIMFAIVYFMLSASEMVSLIIIAAVIVGLLLADKQGYINWLFALFIRHKKVAFISAMLCIIALPLLLATERYIAHIACMAVIYAMVCLGLNFQMGSTDMVNFAPAAFMGIGAYTMAVFTVNMGVSPWLGFLSAIVFSCIAGILIGLPTLRTKGYYLSLVTMALQLAFTQLIKNIPYLGGPNGISGVKSLNIGEFFFYKSYTVFGVKLAPQIPLLFLCLFILVLMVYIAMRVYVSRWGLSLNNIAQDEVAADCLGVNCNRQKLFAFVIGSIFCGIGGALYGGLASFVGPTDFTFARSLIFICMVILGGMDNPIGTVVGALLLTVIMEKVRSFADYGQIIYAVILVTVLIVRPAGLVPKRVRDYCSLFKGKLQRSGKKNEAAAKTE
ncbi:MAG: branched-chain amino acid ABC transporter permease [Bacillota bacterium]|nr:branched-chain amino acid ABC transporter permease [Bacillota bacterium]